MKRSFPANLQFRFSFMLIIGVLISFAYGQARAQPEILPVVAIQYGSTTSGAIGVAGESDTYTFTGEIGDVILIGASKVSGDLWPEVRLYGPDGHLVAEESDPVHVEISTSLPAKRISFLPVVIQGKSGVPGQAEAGSARFKLVVRAPGTYTILVSDGFSGAYTGSYNLYLQKLNPPSSSTSIAYYETKAGNINLPGEMEAFTFSAEANDKVIIGMSKVSGDLFQKFRLYSSEGVLLHEAKNTTHAEATYSIPASGTYTILAADGFNGTYTGSYNLYLQKLNPPTDPTPIAYSQTTAGTINLPGEMDAFTFSAEANDEVIIGMSKVSGDMWQKFRLYSPEGELLHVADDTTHAEATYSIPNTGTYTILAEDGFSSTYTGSYKLFLQKLNPPTNASSIAFSETKSGMINQPAEMDSFTFQADAGAKLIVGMSKVSGDMWQKFRLYDPDGVLLHEAKDTTHAEMVYTTPVSGLFTLLIADGFNGTYTGGYNLFLQRTKDPVGATEIAYGDLTSGSINQPAEMDAFSFTAAANDQVMIRMTKVSGDIWQKIRLYNPDGELIGEAQGPNQAELTQVLGAGGTHTILVGDGFNGTFTGSYNLNLQQLP